jgi:hypothetical protein
VSTDNSTAIILVSIATDPTTEFAITFADQLFATAQKLSYPEVTTSVSGMSAFLTLMQESVEVVRLIFSDTFE